MYVPDNYDQCKIIEKMEEEMHDDLDYCETCYNELKQFKEEVKNEI